MKERKANSGTFKPGNKRGGRPALPEEIRLLTRETKPQLIRSYHKLANLPIDEFKSYKPETIVEAGIKKTLSDYARTGKPQQIQYLWAECHGKPQQSVEMSGNVDMVVNIILEGFEENDGCPD